VKGTGRLPAGVGRSRSQTSNCTADRMPGHCSPHAFDIGLWEPASRGSLTIDKGRARPRFTRSRAARAQARVSASLRNLGIIVATA
jgi:hypothetical protein